MEPPYPVRTGRLRNASEHAAKKSVSDTKAVGGERRDHRRTSRTTQPHPTTTPARGSAGWAPASCGEELFFMHREEPRDATALRARVPSRDGRRRPKGYATPSDRWGRRHRSGSWTCPTTPRRPRDISAGWRGRAFARGRRPSRCRSPRTRPHRLFRTGERARGPNEPRADDATSRGCFVKALRRKRPQLRGNRGRPAGDPVYRSTSYARHSVTKLTQTLLLATDTPYSGSP